jgi:hypothetical protein
MDNSPDYRRTTGNSDPNAPLRAAAIFAIQRNLGLVSEIAKSAGFEAWRLDLWQHLISEVFFAYGALEAAFTERNPAASAWTARNLLELTVWVAYCVRSRDDAKRFYDDEARDVLEFLDSTNWLIHVDEAELVGGGGSGSKELDEGLFDGSGR